VLVGRQAEPSAVRDRNDRPHLTWAFGLARSRRPAFGESHLPRDRGRAGDRERGLDLAFQSAQAALRPYLFGFRNQKGVLWIITPDRSFLQDRPSFPVPNRATLRRHTAERRATPATFRQALQSWTVWREGAAPGVKAGGQKG
jgi:hypothetical protein